MTFSRSSSSDGSEAEKSIFEGATKDEAWFEQLRSSEYGYLDEQNHVYLDYTGSGLPARTQLRAHQERLAGEICGNPHSQSPSSLAATKLVQDARARILQHCKADPEEYVVIFTANATGAAKLIGESYPFAPWQRLVLTYDNHNSVNGLRQYSKRRGCRTTYVPCQTPDLNIDERKLRRALRNRNPFCKTSAGLFAFPAQSNFSGVRHPLKYVAMAQAHGYDVLLDAAAFLPTNEMNLSVIKPEFVMMSFYKMFGYPTGVGCLLARKSALQRLHRPWFSGGTVEAVSVGIKWFRLTDDESAFEDGTLNFQGIPDVSIGLEWIRRIGMESVHRHVQYLMGHLVAEFQKMKHSNGFPMILNYGPIDMDSLGSNISFNILDCEGRIVDERIVGKESSEANISLRTGCFCNPGVGENVFELRAKTLRGLLWSHNPSIDEYIKLLKLPSAGAIRVSFGIASNMSDADRFLKFVRETYRDRVTSSEGQPPRERC